MLISNYAIKFRVAVYAFTVLLAIAGIGSYLRMPREGAPDITIPYVFVTAGYDGTAPAEMERLITIPLEKKLNDVDDVKEMRSTSAENVTFVSMEFVAGSDIDLAKQRVKDKVDLARPDLPEDLDEPLVDAFNFSSDYPVFVFALSGSADRSRLKSLAEALQDEIELIPGVKQAEIAGVPEREIRVEINLPRLAAYDVPLSLVTARIAAENATISAGNIETGGNKFQVRVPGEFQSSAEMRRILLIERGGQPVYLADVADVNDTFKDVSTISRLNGETCVSVTVKKRTGVNAVELIGRIKEKLAAQAIPPDIRTTVVMDQSEYIDSMIKELENNIVSGSILVVVVLLLFMGGRNSLFVALAIPVSMLITFVWLSATGATLNMMVLFSLVMASGMLVDNAIVIVENTYRLRTTGLTRHESARRGTSEVAWPVITSTLTTLAAFSPLLFWPDIMGQFMAFLPRTLIVSLTASLAVALIVNPAICSAWISARPRDRGARPHPFMRAYERFLRGAVRRHVPVVLVGLAFLALTTLLYARYGRGVELFPEVPPRNAMIEVKFPQGTSIERTDSVLRSIERKLSPYEDIKFFLTNVGLPGQAFGPTAGGAGTHVGNIYAEFVKAEQRKGDSAELVNRIREEIGVIPGAELRVQKEREGPPIGAPVAIELSGDDFDTLSEFAGEIIRDIETVPGLVDLQDDFEEALPEVQFRVDRDRAARLGLDTETIGRFLRMSVYGIEASRFRSGEDEYDITLRAPAEQRDSMDLLDDVLIPTAAAVSVPLSSLGRPVYTGGRGAINRKNQKRMVTISGNDNGRGVDKILADVRERVGRIRLPRGYAVRYTGDTEEMQKSGAFLGRAFLVANGLIFAILVLQFNSLVLPALIWFSVVMSGIGVIWGLLICGMRFGIIMTGIGVISLAGVVVNNAIVLIACVQQHRADGLDAVEAVVAAGKVRLRPVLLTAVTTVLGLIPMAVGWSLEIHGWPPRLVAGAESSAWWAPMAVAVIFGLTLATVLTLVLVPAMHALADDVARILRRRFAAREE